MEIRRGEKKTKNINIKIHLIKVTTQEKSFYISRERGSFEWIDAKDNSEPNIHFDFNAWYKERTVKAMIPRARKSYWFKDLPQNAQMEPFQTIISNYYNEDRVNELKEKGADFYITEEESA